MKNIKQKIINIFSVIFLIFNYICIAGGTENYDYSVIGGETYYVGFTIFLYSIIIVSYILFNIFSSLKKTFIFTSLLYFLIINTKLTDYYFIIKNHIGFGNLEQTIPFYMFGVRMIVYFIAIFGNVIYLVKVRKGIKIKL